MGFIIRPARIPDDYVAIAEILTAENPQWATIAEDLAYEDAIRDPRLYHAVFVAEIAGRGQSQLLGVGQIGHDALAHRADKFKLDIRVRPQDQGRGVGDRLYQAVIAHLAPFAPCDIQTEIQETHARAQQFVLARGFREVWRRIVLRLDVSRFDLSPYAFYEQRLRASGITITTYEDLVFDPRRSIKLYELNKALWRDVPYGEQVSERSLEQFANEEVEAPNFIPPACFIAVKDERFIAYSNLISEETGFVNALTGVLPPYRGLGIATAIKVRCIQYAQQHGDRQITTMNDAVNTPMLSLNARLGFRYAGATLRFSKSLP